MGDKFPKKNPKKKILLKLKFDKYQSIILIKNYLNLQL